MVSGEALGKVLPAVWTPFRAVPYRTRHTRFPLKHSYTRQPNVTKALHTFR